MAIRKQDWLEAGLFILAEQGVLALTIESLTGRLKVTKGSFYHHFAGWAEYKSALLLFFETEHTVRVIQTLEQYPTPAEKLRALFSLIVAHPSDLETAVRAWSFQDEQAREMQTRVDAQRLAYLEQLCQALHPGRAAVMARLAYVILVGSTQVHPAFSQATLRQLFDEFLANYDI